MDISAVICILFSIALGEVDETFYTNIYTGQRLPMQRNANIRLQQQQAAVSSVSSLLSPSALAVPPPPIPAALRSNLNRASPTSPAPISGEQGLTDKTHRDLEKN